MSFDWFKDARFGMFLHFGVYSYVGRGEWAVNRERIPFEEYAAYASEFSAENYEPRVWAKVAKAAGMKYMVLTARHHDGFALFDSKVNPFNSANYGPKRDLVAEYVEAVRAEGLKVGLYYSPANWYHPDYPGAYFRDWPRQWDSEEHRLRYIDYYRAELRELMTNYGKIDLLWYDGCAPSGLDGDVTNDMVRRWQPDIILNGRLGSNGDYVCSEQSIIEPKEDRLWEACMTMNDSWAYRYDDCNYKSFQELLKLIIRVAQGGGNLLLNVGPKPDGTLPQQAVALLERMGRWLADNGEAIYGSERHSYSWCIGQMLTKKGNTVYLHSIHPARKLWLAEFTNRVRRVRRLSDGAAMPFTQDGVRVCIETGVDTAGEAGAIVYALEMDGEPQPATDRTTFWIPGIDGKIK